MSYDGCTTQNSSATGELLASDRSSKGLLPGYTVRMFMPGNAVDVHWRPRLVSTFDSIASTIWNFGPDLFGKIKHDLFTEHDRVALMYLESELVGFSVSRAFNIEGESVLFRRFTCILEEHRGKGLYRTATRQVLSYQSGRSSRPLYLGWRTRNPIVWYENAQLCCRVCPDIAADHDDHDLKALAVKACRAIYPTYETDPESLAVKLVYPGDTGYSVQPQHADQELNARFASHPGVRDPHGAVFSLGQVRDDLFRS